LFFVDVAGLQGADTREQLIDAWNRRQNSIRTFQFSWSGKHYARAVSADRGDLACDTQMTLTVDEKRRVRFDVHGNIWSQEKSAYVPQDTTALFDGPMRRNYFSRGEDHAFPSAHISKRDPPTVATDIKSLAIMTAYRPFDTRMNYFDRTILQLSAEQTTIDGHRCVVVEQSERNYLRRIWADASRDFVPVRWVSGPDGRRSIQINISYSKDAKYGWVPTAWTTGLLDGAERIEEGWQTTTVKYKLNETIPDSAFQLNYPFGTWVQDYTTKESYILLEGGKKRPILPREFNGKNYDELLHSKPRQPSRT